MTRNKTICSLTLLLLLLTAFRIQAADSNLTPLQGTPLRKNVLDALRIEVKQMHGLDVIFLVKHLKVKNSWAWVHTQPLSKDGNNKYEDISALLELQENEWKVVEIPCREVDNPKCLNGPEYFKSLLERHPTIPIEIFPE